MADPIKIQTFNIPASVFIEAQKLSIPTILALLQGKEFVSPHERAQINSAIRGSQTTNPLLAAYIKHAGIPDLDNMGELRIIRAGDPLYTMTEAAVKASNEAEIIKARAESREPLLLTMPAIILESERLMNASYTSTVDLMIVGKRMQTSLGPAATRTMIAHELGHKRSMLVNGHYVALPANPLAFLKQITPELFITCQKAGLTDEQTIQLLTSSLLARGAGVKEEGAEQSADDIACRTAVANTTIADIKAIIESNPDIQMQLRKANMVLSREEEHRADGYARDAFGAKAAANYLAAQALVTGRHITDQPHDELDTHPTDAERLTHIGCAALEPETFVDTDGKTKTRLKVECTTEPEGPTQTPPIVPLGHERKSVLQHS